MSQPRRVLPAIGRGSPAEHGERANETVFGDAFCGVGGNRRRGRTCKAADISGAGATFPYPLYAKWADTYKKETGFGLNYQSIGSGGGIKQIKADTVTFGASDNRSRAKSWKRVASFSFRPSWAASFRL